MSPPRTNEAKGVLSSPMTFRDVNAQGTPGSGCGGWKRRIRKIGHFRLLSAVEECGELGARVLAQLVAVQVDVTALTGEARAAGACRPHQPFHRLLRGGTTSLAARLGH